MFPQNLKDLYKGKPGYHTWKHLFRDEKKVERTDFLEVFGDYNDLKKKERD